MLHQEGSTRPGSKARPANGQGTREIHAAAAHTANDKATPHAGRMRCRLSATSTSIAAIQPAHCRPAVRSSSRIASFLRPSARDCRTPPISSDACARDAGHASQPATEAEAGRCVPRAAAGTAG